MHGMEHPGRTAFRRIIHQPDTAIDLVEGALSVAQEDLDLHDTLATRDVLRHLAARTAEQLGPPEPTLQYAEQLVHYLHRVEGFTGNTADYDNPANSYLPLVCTERKGLPITLSLLLLAVAAQNGIALEPAALPAHFMARWSLPAGPVFLDLFFGQVLDGSACRVFLQAQSGATLPDPDLFPPVTHRAVLVRLLNNLKQSYVRRARFGLALAATERLLLLQPNLPEELRDRGMLRLRMDDFHRGLYDLERYVEAVPAAVDQPLIHRQARSIGDVLDARS
ncbi:MAG: tetratricopeptide repeat protein [Herpetosiphonaceae bacterium]|nr:tetratricopeptide repeat protein [Herpetosiphonaceae bacterium]